MQKRTIIILILSFLVSLIFIIFHVLGSFNSTVDKIEIGQGHRGPITKQLQDIFFGLFNGDTEDNHGWLEDIDENLAGSTSRT